MCHRSVVAGGGNSREVLEIAGIQSIKKLDLPPTFQGIANADYIALMLLGFVNHKEDPVGKREEGRLYRRAIVRYINLAIIETLRQFTASRSCSILFHLVSGF